MTFVTIHFVYSSPVGLIEGKLAGAPASGESWKIACMPNLLEIQGTGIRPVPFHRSDDPGAVTCQACKATPVFKKAEESVRSLRELR